MKEQYKTDNSSNNSDVICLDSKYSTTRRLIAVKPANQIYLAPNVKRIFEGGLRTLGYFKRSEKQRPLLTIITIVFNGEKYLEDTIKSVISQSYDNIEYIIIDGGSTDVTLDIIRKYEQFIDYWASESDKGEYDALNKAIEISSGDLIASLNSDDIYYDNETLSKIACEFIKDRQLCWLHGDFAIIDERSMVRYHYRVPRYNWMLLLYAGYCYVLEATSFYRKELLCRVGKFDLSYRYAADYDFFLRIGDKVKNKKLSFPLVKYRYHEQRLSQVHLAAAQAESKEIQGKYRLYHNHLFRWLSRMFFRSILIKNNIISYALRAIAPKKVSI